jgi:hypothetical protein
MGANFHTPWVNSPAAGYKTWGAASVNPTWAELDKALTYLKNIMVGCEGALSWDPTSGVLAWNAQLTLVFNRDDGDACHNHVAAGNVTLTAGQFAYVDLSETNGAAITVLAGTITTEAASNFISFNRLVLAYRSASSGALHFISLDQPFVAATGDVSGPASSGNDNLASFGDTSGKVIADSGIALDDVENAFAAAHTQDTDQYLDYGGPNEISAADLVAAVFGTESAPLEEEANITLYPEYPGAVMTPSGSNNDPGTLGMTSDSEVVNDVRYNYYEWKSSIATPLQSYDVALQIPIPLNFTGFQVGTSVALTIDIKTEETAATNNDIDITINRDGQSAHSHLTSQRSGTAATWTTVGYDETDAVLEAVAAGETLNVLIRLYSMASKYTRIGKINLQIKLI